MWLETTSENSLATGTSSFTDKPNPIDQDSIGRWNNINPNILPSARNHATQNNPTALVDNQPKYIRKGMNGLPALLFDGTNDFFSFDGNFLVGADYTIFVVEARGSDNDNVFLCGNELVANKILILGYTLSDQIIHTHYGSDLIKVIPHFTSSISRIHSFIFSKINGKSIYTNSGTGTPNISQKLPLISYSGSSIGNCMNLIYFNGTIAEIIIYSRALTDKERQGVETYLSKKWGIKLG
jgi:hypothetical protein